MEKDEPRCGQLKLKISRPKRLKDTKSQFGLEKDDAVNCTDRG